MVLAGSSPHSQQGEDSCDEDLLTSKVLPAELQQLLKLAKALSTTDLQTLATQQLDDTVEHSATDDLITGYHCTDGYRRIIVVEGLASKAMRHIFEVQHLPDATFLW